MVRIYILFLILIGIFGLLSVVTTPPKPEVFVRQTLQDQPSPPPSPAPTVPSGPAGGPPPPPKAQPKKLPAPIPAAAPAAAETPAPRVKLPEKDIYEKGLRASVNLLCPSSKNSFTVGTGAIIHPAGYIISNAHVADGYDTKEPCALRRGSPARQFARAELILIPELYRTATSERMRAENDISIWKIDGSSSTFPFWDFDFEQKPMANEAVLTLSYPAEFLSSDIILNNLWLTFSNSTIIEFDPSIVRSTATIAAQHGSSGGTLIDPYTAKIRGLIFGIDEIDTNPDRHLYSLLPRAINAVIEKETGVSLAAYLETHP